MTNVSVNGVVPMVNSTTFSSPPLNQLLNQITTIKLDRGNFLLWKNLALPILRSYKLEGHLLGTKPCPPKVISQITEGTSSSAPEVAAGAEASASSSEDPARRAVSSTTTVVINPLYEAWVTTDQLLLGWLYNSMTSEVATQVMGYENAKDLWEAIQSLFGIQSRAEEDYLRQIFQQTRKGNSKMADYLRLMKSHADNLGQAGSLVSTRNLISQVLLGLDEEYNPVVAMIHGRGDVSWSEMQAELLVFEKRLELQIAQKATVSFTPVASVNMANKGTTNSTNSHNRGWNFNPNNQRGQNSGNVQRGGANFNGSRGRGGRGRGYNNYGNSNRSICQVCGRPGHLALVCYHRFDKEFIPNQNRNVSSNVPNSQNNAGNYTGNSNYAGNSSSAAAFVANSGNPFLANSETVIDSNWYADSGASNHVTGDYNNLVNPREYGGNEQVTVGQGLGSSAAERNP